MRIIRFDSIDSTNLEARRRVAEGETGPAWIISGEQTAGKGRLGRLWISNPGNLYATMILPTKAKPDTISQLSFVAAISVHQTAESVVKQASVSLKWPNDCLLDGAKFCGILAEVLAPGLVAIGIGINIAHVPSGLPYRAACLEGASVEATFEKLAPNLSHWLKVWDEGRGFAAICQAWEERCHHIGRALVINGQRGIFAGLGADGALHLRLANGELKQAYAGDVQFD